MRRFRFHLGSLLILILVLGIGFAALCESTDTWDGSVFSITLSVLLTSILLAIHRTEERRAFWLGFALFGSAYLGFSLIPSIEPRLITTKALTYLDSKFPDREIVEGVYGINSPGKSNRNGQAITSTSVALSSDGSSIITGDKFVLGDLIITRGSAGSASGRIENFMRIGQSLLALIAAFLGGLLSQYLYRKKRQQVQGSVNPLRSHSTVLGD